MPLSIFLITQDEAERLGQVLSAVKGLSDDVVVVDSGSTDQTIDVAKSYGARVFHRDWSGYGAQKRFAEDQCQNDWLLNLDADEVVSSQLREEVKTLFETSDPAFAAYRVRILNVYPGASKPRLFANDYNVVRLYHRSVGRYRDDPIYDRVVLAPGTKVEQLKGAVHHHSLLSWAHMVEKANRFTSHRIERLATKPLTVLKIRLFVEMPVQFVRNYLFRGHIFGGWKGFIFALNTAFLRTLRVAKALEFKEQFATEDAPKVREDIEAKKQQELG